MSVSEGNTDYLIWARVPLPPKCGSSLKRSKSIRVCEISIYHSLLWRFVFQNTWVAQCAGVTMPSNVITSTPSLIAPCHALQTNFSSLFTHNEGLDVPYIPPYPQSSLWCYRKREDTGKGGGGERWTIQKTKTKHEPCPSLANSAHTCTMLRRHLMSLIE